VKTDLEYLDVGIPIPNFNLFTYSFPKKALPKDPIGRRVLVPFRNTKLIGIVFQKTPSAKDKGDIKQIEAFPDKAPLFDTDHLKLIQNISEYYVSPVGITAYNILPEGLRWKFNRKTGRWVIPSKLDNRVFEPTTYQIPSGLTEKMKALLWALVEREELTLSQIKEMGFSQSTLNALLKKGLIREKYPLSTLTQPKLDLQLTPKPTERKGIYITPFLPHRERLKILSSAIGENLQRGRSSLIVLPSIASIQELHQYFKWQFKDRVVVYADTLLEEEKINLWFQLKEKSPFVVLATHLALFIPIKNLGLIAVEEEYSQTYKNLRTPRYDTRRVAFEILKIKKDIQLILGAGVVSTETYYLLATKRAKPTVKTLKRNRKTEITLRKFDFKNIVEKGLLRLMENRKKSFLVITNKKGYSRLLYCERCEEDIKCERCDIPLKVMKGKELFLQCELCGKRYNPIKHCPKCETPLSQVGFGSQKVLEILKGFFGDDVAPLEEGRKRINVVSSLFSKDLTTPEYNYVVNIYPDFQLFIHDFKSNESFFRSVYLPFFKAKEGYILYTNQPKTVEPIKALLENNPHIFYKKELENRKNGGLPPYHRLVILTFEGKGLTLEKVEELFNSFKKGFTHLDYEGIFYAFHTKIRDRNRYQVILRDFKDREKLKGLYLTCKRKNIKLTIEVL